MRRLLLLLSVLVTALAAALGLAPRASAATSLPAVMASTGDSITRVPTLPEPHSRTCPCVRICRSPCIAVNWARISADAANAMNTPDAARPLNITTFAASIAGAPARSGLMSP